jgi:flavin reductase (DIM6/NTAB) family NADH-FMN oxidoreductase RutF
MDPHSFDDLMGHVEHAMVIVTTAAGDDRGGCLVGFHSQCSIDPSRYAVWLSKANHTYRVGVFAEHFAVHVLGEANRALAARFGAKSEDDVDKLAGCDWHEGPDGVPLLDDCPNRIVARRVAMLDTETDHVCFVLEPIDTVWDPSSGQLGLRDVLGLEPGHDAHERQKP